MKKRILSLLLSIIMMIALLPATMTVYAASSGKCGDNATWSYNNGVLTISGTGNMTDYTSMSQQPWSSYRSSITNIIIGDGIEHIGKYAFQSCGGLYVDLEVTLGKNVKTVGYYAFYDTLPDIVHINDLSAYMNIEFSSSISDIWLWGTEIYLNGTLIKDLVIPDTVTTLREKSFYQCNSIESVYIPASVTLIEEDLFRYWNDLKTITVSPDNPNYSSENGVLYNKDKTVLLKYPMSKIGDTYEIPNSVTTIYDMAFEEANIKHINIPSGISIGFWAFLRCWNLETVVLNENVKAGSSAFDDCTKLKNIIVADSAQINAGTFGDTAFFNDSTNWENGVLYIGNKLVSAKTTITKHEIKPGTENICDNAFYGCTQLTEIRFPESLKTVGSYAFYNCKNLQNVYIPTLEMWYDTEFNGYTASPLYYASNLYANNVLITDIKIPETITEIKPYLFYGYKGLLSVTIPDKVKSIGEYAFYDCVNLETIEMGNGVTNIREDAFCNCKKLNEVLIPDSVISIGNSAFYNCTNLTKLTLGKNIQDIGGNAFYGCSNLYSLWITDLKAYMDISFGNYSAYPTYYADVIYLNNELLTDVTIPDGIELLSNYIFYSNNEITSVFIPDSVTQIELTPFSYCYNLACITVDTDNLNYSSDETGVLYNKDKTTLIKYPAGNKSIRYSVANTVSNIERSAFYNCSNLAEIYLPISCKEIASTISKPSTTKLYYTCNVQYRCNDAILLEENVVEGENAKLLNDENLWDKNASYKFYLNGIEWDGTNVTENITVDVSIIYDKCDILKVNSPSEAIIDEENKKIIANTVDSNLSEILIDLNVSTNASWELRRSLSLPAIDTKVLPLRGAGKTTKAYITITSQDENNTQTYTLEIYQPIKSEKPEISFVERTVSISALPGSKIIYTIDGTEPSATNGTIYQKPFQVTETVTVKAICLNEGSEQYSEVTTLVVNGYPDLTVECLYLEELSNTAEYEFDFVISTEEISGLNAVFMIAGYNRDGKFVGMHTETLYDTKNKVAEVYGEFALEEKATTFKTMLWRGYNSLYPLCESATIPIE